MTDTNEQKWQKEAEVSIDPSYAESPWNIKSFSDSYVKGYLAARKKAHSEREDAFKAFTLVLADRYEKEIEKLKEEIDFKDSQLKTREAVLNKEIERLHKKVTSLHGSYDEAVIIFNGECEKRDKILGKYFKIIKKYRSYLSEDDDEIIHEANKEYKELKR